MDPSSLIFTGKEVRPYDLGNGFIPYRRNIKYLPAQSVQNKPLIEGLSFITDKKQWGYKFRFPAFEIPKIDMATLFLSALSHRIFIHAGFSQKCLRSLFNVSQGCLS